MARGGDRGSRVDCFLDQGWEGGSLHVPEVNLKTGSIYDDIPRNTDSLLWIGWDSLLGFRISFILLQWPREPGTKRTGRWNDGFGSRFVVSLSHGPDEGASFNVWEITSASQGSSLEASERERLIPSRSKSLSPGF